MDKEQIKKIINSSPQYNGTKEDTMCSWLTDAYSKRMRWIMILVNVGYILLGALLIFSVFKFFGTDQSQYQIMYAVIFVFCSHWIGFMSVFGWVMMQRPRISRLEFRIAELIETIKGK